MNEYIEIRFRRHNRPLRIARQGPEGVELDERDPIPRSVYIAFDAANEVTRARMRHIRQLHGWAPGDYKLRLSVDDGAIVLRGVDPFALQEGRYFLTVELEDAKTRQRRRTVAVEENGHGTSLVDVETDDRDVEVDLTECDAEVRRVLDASRFDNQSAVAWIEDDDARPARKACLLNLLASLRARPTVSAPLIRNVQAMHWISNDRAYARVDRELLARLETLSRDPRKPFYRGGRPTAHIHRRLIASVPENVRNLFSPDRLLSFRGEGGPSLQIVIAEPPAGVDYTFAELDLDLGNALQDVVGFFVHMGELADGKPTNHLDLRKRLAKSSAGRFLYYSIVSA